ncbi:mucoidy inhibitor MuiA [soil metagenome]
MRTLLSLILLAGFVPLHAADEVVKPAPSKVSAVTVYLTTALITRDVTVPDAAGLQEVVVSPMPPSTLGSSIYAEGTDGIRILSARFRTRTTIEDTREDVRKLETKLKDLTRKQAQMAADSKANTENLGLLLKLESFTAATLGNLTEKGLLDSEKIILLAKFIQDSRSKQVKDETTLKQAMETNKEEIEFTTRQIQEKTGGVSTRTDRDAVIVIDKAKVGAGGIVKLNYLVSDASWKPQYKLKAGTKDGDKIMVEYQAAVIQQTGEDWTGVAIELSTSQNCQNAAPPDLKTLEVAIGGGGAMSVAGAQPAQGGSRGPAGPGDPGGKAYADGLFEQSRALKSRAASNSVNQKQMEAGKDWNDAAALDQFRDLLLSKEELVRGELITDLTGDGPSVTYLLKNKLSLPSRNDEHVIEIDRMELAPKFFYKAVPVLTPHVYRIAELVNTTNYVLLPGEATMYLGKDFVGSTRMPLVAMGKPFSAGFGVDPQLQVSRKLIDKSRTTQGGNQVLKFDYRILLSSYKKEVVEVQVWDRMPHANAAQTIAITIISEKPKLSEDPLYVRDDKPKNLLRWDVKIDPKQNGEKALNIDYEYRLEVDKNVSIGAFLAK